MSAAWNTPADFAAMRADAWAGFVSDYVLAVDADPGEARARYARKIDAIAQRERMAREQAA